MGKLINYPCEQHGLIEPEMAIIEPDKDSLNQRVDGGID